MWRTYLPTVGWSVISSRSLDCEGSSTMQHGRLIRWSLQLHVDINPWGNCERTFCGKKNIPNFHSSQQLELICYTSRSTKYEQHLFLQLHVKLFGLMFIKAIVTSCSPSFVYFVLVLQMSLTWNTFNVCKEVRFLSCRCY